MSNTLLLSLLFVGFYRTTNKIAYSNKAVSFVYYLEWDLNEINNNLVIGNYKEAEAIRQNSLRKISAVIKMADKTPNYKNNSKLKNSVIGVLKVFYETVDLEYKILIKEAMADSCLAIKNSNRHLNFLKIIERRLRIAIITINKELDRFLKNNV